MRCKMKCRACVFMQHRLNATCTKVFNLSRQKAKSHALTGVIVACIDVGTLLQQGFHLVRGKMVCACMTREAQRYRKGYRVRSVNEHQSPLKSEPQLACACAKSIHISTSPPHIRPCHTHTRTHARTHTYYLPTHFTSLSSPSEAACKSARSAADMST